MVHGDILAKPKPKPKQDPKTGRFTVGNGGNGGRPRGSRSKLREVFMVDMVAAWETHGVDAINKVAVEKPETFLKVVASLLPTRVSVDQTVTHEHNVNVINEFISQLSSIAAREQERRITTNTLN